MLAIFLQLIDVSLLLFAVGLDVIDELLIDILQLFRRTGLGTVGLSIRTLGFGFGLLSLCHCLPTLPSKRKDKH